MEDGTCDLRATALALCRPGFGILAADESTGTIGKRLGLHGVANSAAARLAFREVVLCAPGSEVALSGAILFDETFRQRTAGGVRFVDALRARGVFPGVKVDAGLRPLPAHPGETHTAGLDGLPARCAEYAAAGARFAKWRAALRVDPAAALPSDAAVAANASALAAFARVALAAGLVPLVEPEILLDGAHGLDAAGAAARKVLRATYAALRAEGVDLAATLLKPMMVVPGRDFPERAGVGPAAVARATLDVLRDAVPPEVPGVMFLSGGMSEREATANLNALARLAAEEDAPWRLSFSFGRALQSSPLAIWAADHARAAEASAVAAQLAAVNGRATLGEYDGNHPSTHAAESLYESFRGWRSGGDMPGT